MARWPFGTLVRKGQGGGQGRWGTPPPNSVFVPIVQSLLPRLECAGVGEPGLLH